MAKPYKVLFVDDSKSILAKLLEGFAAQTDFETKAVTNPLKAYKLIEDEHFDIVISDIEMPEMNGLEMLRKIKNHNGMIQVIIMTSYITVNNTLNAFRYGASDLVFKPFEISEMIAAAKDAARKLDRVKNLLDRASSMKKANTAK